MSTRTVPAADTAPSSMTVRAHARLAASAMCDAIEAKARVELERQNQLRAAELAAEVARARSAVHKTWLASVAAGVTALATLVVAPLMGTTPTLSRDADTAATAPRLALDVFTARSDARAVREQGTRPSRAPTATDENEDVGVRNVPCDENDPMAFCLRK